MKTKTLATLVALSSAASFAGAANIDLGWSAAGLTDGALATWDPTINATSNAGMTWTGGGGGLVQSGSTNFANVSRWVNEPAYNLAANPNDSWQDGLGNPETQANMSFEMVMRPGDFTGKHTLFNTGGNGDGTAFVLEGSTLDFRFQDANNDNQRVIAKADLSLLGVAGDFFHVVGVGDITSAATGMASIYVNGSLIDSVTSVGNIADWDGGDLAELGKGGNIPGGSPFDPDAFTGDIASFNYYGGELVSASEAASNHAALSGAIPEPSTGILAVLGLALAVFRRRR